MEGLKTLWMISDSLEDFRKCMKISGQSGLKQMKPERKAMQTSFTGETHIDWNHPVVLKVDYLIRDPLNRWFGSRGRWHFKTGTSKLYTSEVVIRKNSEIFGLCFLNKTYKCEIYFTIHCLRYPNHTCHPLRQKVTLFLVFMDKKKHTMNDCRENII